MTTSAKSIKHLFIRHLLLCAKAERLIEFGERALALRDGENLQSVGERLSEMSEGGLSYAGAYYSALALNQSQATRAQAEALLEQIAVSGPCLFRAKALLALAYNLNNHHGDARTAEGYYSAALSANPGNLLVMLTAKSQQAVIRSLAGDHRRALADFESIKSLAASVGVRLPFYRANYFNSLAHCYLMVGNLEQAEGYSKLAIESNYQVPVFNETHDEIAHRRSLRAQRSLKSEATRKAAARRELHGLLIVPQKPDPFTANGLESLVQEVRQGKFRY